MNEKELKEELLAAGVTEEQLDSLDFTKIEEIFDNTQNADELCMEIQKNFSDFDEKSFKTMLSEQEKESEKTEDLSDEALEEVAGGSAGSWFKKNKDWVITAAVIGALGIAVGGKKLWNKIDRKKFIAKKNAVKTIVIFQD